MRLVALVSSSSVKARLHKHVGTTALNQCKLRVVNRESKTALISNNIHNCELVTLSYTQAKLTIAALAGSSPARCVVGPGARSIHRGHLAIRH